MKKELKKGDVITVLGRRWFERVNGNTYHSVRVYVNGDFIDGVNFTYGYGNQYETTALKILSDNYKNIDEKGALWWLKKEKGVKIVNNVCDVRRKKDLVNDNLITE